MKKIFTLLALMAGLTTYSQTSDVKLEIPQRGALLDGKTVVKTNLVGFFFRNYGFSAERMLGKRMSLGFNVNSMAKGDVPFISLFNLASEYQNAQIQTSSFMPEIRIYIGGKGYGNGFYLSPYYKQDKLNISNLRFTSTISNLGSGSGNLNLPTKIDNQIDLSGDISAKSFGLMMGIQWMVGSRKNIVIDWGILGAHYGKSEGEWLGTSSMAMTQAVQDEIKAEILKATDLSIIKREVEMSANSAKVTFSGPWAFLRTYLSVGFRF